MGRYIDRPPYEFSDRWQTSTPTANAPPLRRSINWVGRSSTRPRPTGPTHANACRRQYSKTDSGQPSKTLNPWLTDNNLTQAVNEIQQVAGTNTMAENEAIHELLIRHTTVEQDRGHGKKHQTVKFLDFDEPENNDFFALNQFRVEGPREEIKPDIVLFVNGLPLGVIECKAPDITEPRPRLLIN